MANPGPDPMGLIDFHCRLYREDAPVLKSLAAKSGISASELLREIVARLSDADSVFEYVHNLQRSREQDEL